MEQNNFPQTSNPSPISLAVQSIKGKGPVDFSNTDDYHLLMSNWLHSQIENNAFNNMSGKEIVNQFNQQKNIINRFLQQKGNQVLNSIQQNAIQQNAIQQPLNNGFSIPTTPPNLFNL